MQLKGRKKWFSWCQMAMTSEMDPLVLLEASEEGFSGGFIAD